MYHSIHNHPAWYQVVMIKQSEFGQLIIRIIGNALKHWLDILIMYWVPVLIKNQKWFNLVVQMDQLNYGTSTTRSTMSAHKPLKNIPIWLTM